MTVAVLVGLQASGKTTFAATARFDGWERLSKDDWPNARHRQQRLVRKLGEAVRAGRDVDGADPAANLRWRELGARDVAEVLAHQAHAGADLHDGRADPGRLLGTFYRDRRNLGAREDGGLYFHIPDRDYLHSRPLAVQRYCQTDHAASLHDNEEQAADTVVAELAELAGELTAADRAAGVLSRSPQDPDQVAVLYATALALARDDDAAFDRARELKAEYDAWWLRWHGLYTDAQPAGVDVFGLPQAASPAAPTGPNAPDRDQ